MLVESRVTSDNAQRTRHRNRERHYGWLDRCIKVSSLSKESSFNLGVQHATFAGVSGAVVGGRPDGGEGHGDFAPLEDDAVGVEDDVPELPVVAHQGLAHFFGFVAHVLGHEARALDAARPPQVRLVALDACDALAGHHVEQHGARLVLDDLTLLRVPAGIAEVQHLEEQPPEAHAVLEPGQKLQRAVVAVVVAHDEHVRVERE